MELQDMPAFTALLMEWAYAYYPNQVDKLCWDVMPEGYFEDLAVLTLDEVREVLVLARRQSAYWPSCYELRELGHVEQRERAQARAQQAAKRLPAARNTAEDAATLAHMRTVLAQTFPGWNTPDPEDPVIH